MINDSLFSSRTEEWATPQDLFNKLNTEFNFTLDPCATADNAKCSKFFTKEQDGLAQSWQGERVFMNPPYGRSIGLWIKKAYEEAGGGRWLFVLFHHGLTLVGFITGFTTKLAKLDLLKAD